MTDSDDEPVTLSADALAALSEFYRERDEHAERLERLKAAVEVQHQQQTQQQQQQQQHDDGDGNGDEDRIADNRNGTKGGEGNGDGDADLSIHAFVEDWNESQFWYSDETAALLARQLLDGASADSVVAVVSTPSVFVALRNIVSAADYAGPRPRMYLLEHDRRFAVFPEFVFYDFAQPFRLPGHLKGAVDRVICDGPFLSEDCQTKIAITMRWLLAPPQKQPQESTTPPPQTPQTPQTTRRILVCTGERVAPLVARLYRPLGVRATTFEPAHRGGRLQNAFRCHASFECPPHWRWVDAAAADADAVEGAKEKQEKEEEEKEDVGEVTK
ncbi:putative N6-adenine methyltransferase-domain-containing protein [Xylariaceae sp. FL0804]|nr:putative N6-adenine methyltransferase-domain-containing protein [Xylariaceae sp. FL0804]